MELGNLGGVFDTSIPLYKDIKAQVLSLPVPMRPVLQSIFTLKDRLLVLSNASSGTSSVAPCKRTIVTYDGELVESSGDEDYGSNNYQRSVTIHGESDSNDYAYCLANYTSTNEYLYKYDVAAHTFTRLGSLPTNTSVGYYGGLANTYIQLRGRIYWFGIYSTSSEKEIRVELIDPNTAIATRLATVNVYNDATVPSGSYVRLPVVGTDGNDNLYLMFPENTSYCTSQLWKFNVTSNKLELLTRYPKEDKVTAFGEYGSLYVKDDTIYYVHSNIRSYREGGKIKYSKIGSDKWLEINDLPHVSAGSMNVTCFRDGVLMTRAGDYNPTLFTFNQ